MSGTSNMPRHHMAKHWPKIPDQWLVPKPNQNGRLILGKSMIFQDRKSHSWCCDERGPQGKPMIWSYLKVGDTNPTSVNFIMKVTYFHVITHDGSVCMYAIWIWFAIYHQQKTQLIVSIFVGIHTWIHHGLSHIRGCSSPFCMKWILSEDHLAPVKQWLA